MSNISPTAGVSGEIPHYGDPALSQHLIDALRMQTTERPLQIIIVDDHHPTPYPDPNLPGIQVVRRDVNGGFGSTVNTGAAYAQHPLLLILNSDLTIGVTFIEELCRAAEKWLPAIVSPTVVDGNGSNQYVGRMFPTITRSVIAGLVPLARWRDDARWHRAVGHEIPDPPTEATICDWFIGAVILMPTKAFHQLGGFDERFYMNSEEVDLQRRAREINLPSVVLADVTVEHVGGGSSDDARRFLWLMQGEWRYRTKWEGKFRARSFQAAMLGVTVINLVWNSVRSLFGRPTRPLQTFQRGASAIIRSSRD